MDQYACSEIEEMMKVSENNTCNDCNSITVRWASCNNAVFLCINCAGVHRSLGPNISVIKSLCMDAWTEKEIKILQRGGNKRFLQLLRVYNIDNKTEIKNKYRTGAVNYFRKLIVAEVNETELPIMPNETQALELLEQEDSKVNAEVKIEIEAPSQSYYGQFTSFIDNAKKSAESTYDSVKNKTLQEMGGMIVIKGSEIGGQIGEKIKTTSSNAYEHVKSSITTNVIQPSQKVLNENFVEPSKKIYESEFIQTIKNKTGEGLSSIARSEFVQSIKNKTEEGFSSIARSDFVKTVKDRTSEGISYVSKEFFGKSETNAESQTNVQANVETNVNSEVSQSVPKTNISADVSIETDIAK